MELPRMEVIMMREKARVHKWSATDTSSILKQHRFCLHIQQLRVRDEETAGQLSEEFAYV